MCRDFRRNFLHSDYLSGDANNHSILTAEKKKMDQFSADSPIDAAVLPARPTAGSWGISATPATDAASIPNSDDRKGRTTRKKDRKKAVALGLVQRHAPPPRSSESKRKPREIRAPRLPLAGRRNILITSALPYVNNVPHLGNIIGCVLSADVYARFCRLRGHNAIYICGTDEYGTATEIKAIEAKLTPKEICDKYFAIHKQVYEWFDISFDHFGRTTCADQEPITQDIFNRLDGNGFITTQNVDQPWCDKDQRFLSDRFVYGKCPICGNSDARGDQCDKCGNILDADKLIGPKCKLCNSTPVFRSSKHLFIDLPKMQPMVEKWFHQASVKGEWSPNAIATTRSWLGKDGNGLQPRCITRDLKWGTKVPQKGFEDKRFYVWFDAPIGYISITADYLRGLPCPSSVPDTVADESKGEAWRRWWNNPEQVELWQFMGKDNIPFHCVIFPCTLIGADQNYTLLHHISTTEYLQYAGGKFSKSRNQGVFGDDAAKTNIPAEVWRYYLLINRPENSDTTFDWQDFQNKNNNELLKDLGNFVMRSLSLIKEKFRGDVPAPGTLGEAECKLQDEISGEIANYIKLLEGADIRDALKVTMNISRLGNSYLQTAKPWEKSVSRARQETIMCVCANLVYLLGILTEPFMPSISEQILEQLNLPMGDAPLANEKKRFELSIACGHKIGTPVILFRHLEDKEIAELKERFQGEIKKTGERFPLLLRVGKITAVKDVDHPTGTHLYELTVECGEEVDESKSVAEKKQSDSGTRTMLSPLRAHYTKDQLIGKTPVVLLNIQPNTIKQVMTQGIVLIGFKEGKAGLLLSSAPVGSLVAPDSTKAVLEPAQTFNVKNLPKLNLITGADGVGLFGDLPLLANGQLVTAEGLGAGADLKG